MKKQVMYYGPPGTGKTYRLKEESLRLICPELEMEISELEDQSSDEANEIDISMIKNRFATFYANNPSFLNNGVYKPGKKTYRNLSSLNKLMKLFVDENVNSMTKNQIIHITGWKGPSSYVQHERVLTNFDLVKEDWQDKHRDQLTLNKNGQALKEKYQNYMSNHDEFPDRDLPEFAIEFLKNILINTTRDNMSLWKNTILSVLWLGIENGYVFKYRRNAKPADTEKAKEIYDMVYGKSPEEITQEQEEQIKGFLLIYRTHRAEYLKERHNDGKWHYKEQIEKLGLEE